MNIVNAIIGQAIFASPLSDSTNTNAISTIFGIFLFLYLALSVGVILSKIINKRRFKKLRSQKRLLIVIFGHIITTVAGLAYLIGDNINALFATYRSELNCDTACLEAVGNVGTALLIISLLLFGIAPTFLSGAITVSDLIYNVSEESDHLWSRRMTTAHSIALIVELDAWFSAVADLPAKSSSFCPQHDLTILWVLYCITIFLWAVVLVVLFTPGIIKAITDNDKKLRKIFLVVFLAISIWISSAFAIIADNSQPIGCLFECDFNTGNRTNVCNEGAQHGTRIGLLLLALIPLAVISSSLLIHWIKKIRKLYSSTPQENKHSDINETKLKSFSEVEEKSSKQDINY